MLGLKIGLEALQESPVCHGPAEPLDDREFLRPGAQVALSETYCRVLAADEDAAGVTNPEGDGFDDTSAYEEFGVNSYLGAHMGPEGDVRRDMGRTRPRRGVDVLLRAAAIDYRVTFS